jgi:hypothetical protein
MRQDEGCLLFAWQTALQGRLTRAEQHQPHSRQLVTKKAVLGACTGTNLLNWQTKPSLYMPDGF